MSSSLLLHTARWREAIRPHYSLINLIGFKLNWIMLVGFQSQLLIPSLLIYGLCVLLNPAPRRGLALTVPLALTGIALDSLLSIGGLFDFGMLLIPAWLILLWFSFTLALPYGLHFLARLPVALQALIGAMASLSYPAGWQLGAVSFPLPLWLTALILALIWACLLPLFLRWAHRTAT